ncbi:Acg family FMN-binding oxidoreductase [Streptomyces beihaiensis]|uniref:Nitroreductase family protein n=1 Tax=Streptomyces beihaiensis TaxID=2984495 RepID=A0ABT3U0D1_9ACTN|nr:nitroreductase family protein [Streptomyces beihaiensis]MCX3062768.1 nitroreductase family protein [Streptomyces beihaiensis]
MPNRPLDETTVTRLVQDASTAPSMHNAQPWRFRFLADSGTLELSADPDREMPRTDPDRRALHLGCGAALFNLRVSAAHAGLRPEVTLLPDPGRPLLLATVHADGTEGPSRHDPLRALYPVLRMRHSSRWPFDDTPLDDAVQASLVDAARAEGAGLVFVSDWHVQELADLVHDAEGRDDQQPERLDEMTRWTHRGAEAESATEGIPDYAFGPRMRGGAAPMRDFAGRRPLADRASATFESTPHIALLGTARDGPRDWLMAGQAMERVLLTATLKGLATSLTSHALEWPDLRGLARDPRSSMGHVQIVLRVGHGPQGPATPRRPVTDILTVVHHAGHGSGTGGP